MAKKTIGILTGGGDAPGLNAVIRAVTWSAIEKGYDVVGFERGWAGLLNKVMRPLSISDVADIHREGGTILFSSRTNVAKIENGFETAKKNLVELDIHCLVAMGGEDTLGVAAQLHEAGGQVVGAPKTIDNDVNATDYTFGFDTATNRVMESLDRLHTTAKAHQRVMVVEVMGRHAGWMALEGGMAGGAHYITIPEQDFDIDDICRVCKARYERGEKYAIIAVAEGSSDPKLLKAVQHSAELDSFGHVQLGTGRGIGEVVAEEIEERTGLETRHVVPAHLQRGGDPTSFDRNLGTRLGVKVVELIEAEDFGKMASLRGSEILGVPLADAVGELKTVPIERYEQAKKFFR
jgi:ATP-dependent phosphofructokinase / diphosphate-dependent phosphofructokinase